MSANAPRGREGTERNGALGGRQLEHALDRPQRACAGRLGHVDPGREIAQAQVELLERVLAHERALVAGAALVRAGRLDQLLVRGALLDLVEYAVLGRDDQRLRRAL